MFRSLRWKITAWYLGAAALVVLLVGLTVFLIESRALSEQIDGSIRASGDSVKAATSAKLRVGNYQEPLQAAEEAIDTVVTHEWLNANDVFLVLLNPEGDIVANPDHVDAGDLANNDVDLGDLRAEAEEWANIDLAGTQLRTRSSPLFDNDGNLLGFVLAGRSTEDRDSALRDLAMALTGGGILSLLLLGFAGYLVAGRAIRPVQEGFLRQRQFVADASHELRTPLAVIRTNSELLMRRYDGDEALEDIEAETRYMIRLVDDLLLLADSDRGRLHVKPESVDLSDQVQAAAKMAATLAPGAGLDFRSEIAAPLPAEVDPERSREAILILLDNALKYTPSGGNVVLSARRQDGYAVVEVADTGIGMSKDEAQRASDRFFAANLARTRNAKGRGLGLSIANALVAAMNGSLELESEVGQGTRARLRFPLSMPEEPRTDAALTNRRPRWLRAFGAGRSGETET